MRRVVLAILSTVASLVLLLSFKTHGASVATPPAASSNATGSTSSGSTTTSSGATNASGTKTATGASVDTRYGPVQVKVTVTNGKVTSAAAIDYPLNNGRDQQINAYAIPALNQEALQSGSASIDMISGATYTSEGYIQSLQSALDKVS
jgi:uncharacterized protein with FMN-binding domain